MGFLHSMICETEGIQAIAPVQWRSFDEMCAVYWHARATKGASGYYISPDPRIMLFFDDVSDRVRMAEDSDAVTTRGRPMLQAQYVPPGRPMWTRFSDNHKFSHLDLHFNRRWLETRLGPVLGEAGAKTAIRRPVERQDVAPLIVIGHTLARELAAPSRHPLFAESLAMSLISGLLDLSEEADLIELVSGGLTPMQMRRLRALVAESGGGRLSTASLAEAVGLSESWFTQAFKKTTGKTPLQWQQEQRIALVKELLLRADLSIAAVADRFGFADQAHLTRVFRQYEGTTPAAWRREQRLS
ncbi:helix-turn-helix domain-containing protein [Celeribacter sp. SCSIO 80788]|uniref:helix-turn-helix domain-containing protein n=1 Tax=Celeribacter sp. SCSIO 80788 TaxID=3117013 RepID=UPI003DA5CE07